MRLRYPGIGGSLGECVVCGKSFAFEIIMGQGVPMIGIDGFEKDLPVHKRCLEELEKLRGGHWSTLPDGPLRREYAEVLANSETTHDPTQP